MSNNVSPEQVARFAAESIPAILFNYDLARTGNLAFCTERNRQGIYGKIENDTISFPENSPFKDLDFSNPIVIERLIDVIESNDYSR